MKINECSCGCGGTSTNCMEKNEYDLNYMFLGNLKTMKRMIDDLMQMDPKEINMILNNGHEWAVDHIASSADDVQEVYNFLKNQITTSTNKKMDAFSEDNIFIKTFESYISEVSSEKWREIETDLRGKKMDVFADRVASHNKQYGTHQNTEIKLVGMQRGVEVYLSVTDLELQESFGSNFIIAGMDSDFGKVIIHGFTTHRGTIQMFEGETMPLLAADRKNAMNLIKFLVNNGAIDNSNLDWRQFTNGYISFKEAYKI